MFHDGQFPLWVQDVETSISLFQINGLTLLVVLTSQPAVEYLAQRLYGAFSALSDLLSVLLSSPIYLSIDAQTCLMPTLAREDAPMHVSRLTIKQSPFIMPSDAQNSCVSRRESSSIAVRGGTLAPYTCHCIAALRRPGQ